MNMLSLWHANGKQATEEVYVEGKRHGRHAMWNEFRELRLDLQYENGQIVLKR